MSAKKVIIFQKNNSKGKIVELFNMSIQGPKKIINFQDFGSK